MVLEPCAGVVGSGDGRELFSFQPGGQVMSVVGNKCLGVSGEGIADGNDIILVDCDKAPKWEFSDKGQLKVDGPEGMCLSQKGLAPGIADVARKAAVVASSTINVQAHGARVVVDLACVVSILFSVCEPAGATMAVDDDVDTYWASKFDELDSPVEYVIDFGEEHKLQSVEVVWEFPARAFAIAASADGARFSDVFATDANVLHTSRISLGHVVARKLRISLVEVRCLDWERSDPHTLH